jgi:uncharacterized protein YecA (UPF0149 family)
MEMSNDDVDGRCLKGSIFITAGHRPAVAITPHNSASYRPAAGSKKNTETMSYTRLLYHIVFHTKYGHPAIPEAHEKELYVYIMDIVNKKNRNCTIITLTTSRRLSTISRIRESIIK